MKTVFSKFNSERLPKYQLLTKILKSDNAEMLSSKESMCRDADEHLKNVYNNYEMLKSRYDINLVKPTLKDDKIYFEIAKGESLETLLLDAMQKDNKELVEHLLKKFFDFIDSLVDEKDVQFKPTREFIDIFGEWEIDEKQDVIAIANIDLIFSNMFLDDGEFTIIDYEWVFDFAVPKSFVVWRSIYDFSEVYNLNLTSYLDFNYDEYHKPFLKMSKRFENGIRGVEKKYFLNENVLKPKIDIVGRNNFVQLFIDNGDSFSDDVSKIVYFKNQTSLNFNLSKYKNIKALRFDPFDDYVIVRLDSIKSGKYLFDIKSSNALYVVNNTYYFNTIDPQIYLDIPDNISVDNIDFNISYIKIGDLAKAEISSIYIEIIEEEKLQLKQEMLDKEQKYINNNAEMESLKDELTLVYTGFSWKITRVLRKLKALFR